MKHGKKYVDSVKLIDNTKLYEANEAFALVCQTAKAKFDADIKALKFNEVYLTSTYDLVDTTTFSGSYTASLVEKIGDNYDIITANIVADILIAMKELFYKFLKPGGILIISGIIDERKEEVTDAVTSAGFEIKEFCEQSDWAAVMLVKK